MMPKFYKLELPWLNYCLCYTSHCKFYEMRFVTVVKISVYTSLSAWFCKAGHLHVYLTRTCVHTYSLTHTHTHTHTHIHTHTHTHTRLFPYANIYVPNVIQLIAYIRLINLETSYVATFIYDLLKMFTFHFANPSIKMHMGVH